VSTGRGSCQDCSAASDFTLEGVRADAGGGTLTLRVPNCRLTTRLPVETDVLVNGDVVCEFPGPVSVALGNWSMARVR